jgi:hypothetical protein
MVAFIRKRVREKGTPRGVASGRHTYRKNYDFLQAE